MPDTANNPTPPSSVTTVAKAVVKISGAVKAVIILIIIVIVSVGLNVYLIKSNKDLGDKLSIKKAVENILPVIQQTKETNAQGIVYIYITNKISDLDLLNECNGWHTDIIQTNLVKNNLNVSLFSYNKKTKITRDIDIDFTPPDYPSWEFTGTVWLAPDIEADVSGGYRFIPRLPLYFGASVGYETVLKQAKLGVNVTYLKQ